MTFVWCVDEYFTNHINSEYMSRSLHATEVSIIIIEKCVIIPVDYELNASSVYNE